MHLSKTIFPIEITDFGKITCVSDVHPLKAESFIENTDEGISIFFQ